MPLRGDHTVSSTHLPVDAWAAPALTVVTMLLNAVCKHLLEPLTPLLGGRPTVKGWGFPGGSGNLPAFTLGGTPPQVELLGRMVIPCVILEAPPRGLSRRPQRLRPAAVPRGSRSPHPRQPLLRSALCSRHRDGCEVGSHVAVFSFFPHGFDLRFPNDQRFVPSLKKYPFKRLALF